MDDTVRVNVEGDFDLRKTPWRGHDAFEIEAAERPVRRGKFALALKDMDGHRALVVRCRREGLAFRDGNRRVALDELRANAPERLDTQRERRHIEEQNVFYVA